MWLTLLTLWLTIWFKYDVIFIYFQSVFYSESYYCCEVQMQKSAFVNLQFAFKRISGTLSHSLNVKFVGLAGLPVLAV